MANCHLRRPAARTMGKPSVKGLSSSNPWATLAMLEDEDESVLQLDWLSNLPDDLLLNIIERLDVADAMRTSILSRRWKLLPTMLSKVLIMVGSADLIERSCDAARANATVLGAARSLLETNCTSSYTIHRLSMQFFVGDGFIEIGRTVAKTIAARKVGFAEFTILTEKAHGLTRPDMLAYGRQFASFLDACPNTFSCLTRLKLENLSLGETDFPKLLRLCKRLEFLRLDNCDMGFMSFLAVEHPRLREIDIYRCNFERIDLNWLPELTTLTFSCWMSWHYPLSFSYVPLLQNLSISNVAQPWQKMLKLSEFLGKSAITSLCLGFERKKIWVKPEDPIELSQVFSKLRLVHFTAISDECDLIWTMFVLQGAPSLEELGIRVCNCSGDKDSEERKDAGAKWEESDFKHHNLTVLRIFGFQKEDKFLDYAKAVMKAAVNLEDIYLHEKPACMVGCRYIPRGNDGYPRSKWEKFLVRDSLGLYKRRPARNSPGMYVPPLLRLHFVS